MQRQRQQILAVSGITAAVLAVGGGIAIAMSGSGSATPPATPADQGAVVQITDAPSSTSSVAVTTTEAAPKTTAKVEVQTTEKGVAPKRTVQQRAAAEGDDENPADTSTDQPPASQPTPATSRQEEPTCTWHAGPKEGDGQVCD